MKHKIILIYLASAAFLATNSVATNNLHDPDVQQEVIDTDARFFGFGFETLFNNFIYDLIDVNAAVFKSVDTLKILTWVLPVYLGTRYADDMIHASFYDAALHQNINHMSSGAHKLSNTGITALTVALALFPLFPSIDVDLRRTSSLFGKGVLSLAAIRTFIKNSIRARSSCRPWNGNFSNKERALGGFPSGHMAFAGYMTSLFGLRHGPKWGMPLSIFSAFSFFASINCNRHYASQLVGGLGLGVIYGWGSYKILNSRYGEHATISFDLDRQNRPSFSVGYDF